MEPISKLTKDEMDRLVSGRPVQGKPELDELAGFVSDLKAASVEQPAAELEAAHLQTIMRAVESSRDTAVLPESALPRRSRKRAWALKAAAAGLGAALLTGGLAAANALPDPVQHAVSRFAGAVSPFEFPDPASEKAAFGGRVSTDATDSSGKGVDGQQISEEARRLGDQRRQDGEHPEGQSNQSPGAHGAKGSKNRPESPDPAQSETPGDRSNSSEPGTDQHLGDSGLGSGQTADAIGSGRPESGDSATGGNTSGKGSGPDQSGDSATGGSSTSGSSGDETGH